MNLRKLADEAGVSVSTVSKAFNNADDVSDATKKRIFSIAKKHGCYSKYKKQRFEKKVVAVMCPEINSEYYTSIIECLKTSIEANNAIMVISEYNFNVNKLKEQIEYFSSYLHVDGIITFTLPPMTPDDIDTPSIVIGGYPESGFTCVSVDCCNAMMDAIKHLSLLNHKSIAFIGDLLTSGKRAAFSECMNKLRLPLMKDNIIVVDSRFEDAGREAVEFFLKTGCTAVICAYDYIAFGVIDRLSELGYKVPDDYSVIGMDNVRASEYNRESLTTISYPVNEMCNQTVKLLMDKINNKYNSDYSHVLDSRLVVRGSTSQVANKWLG